MRNLEKSWWTGKAINYWLLPLAVLYGWLMRLRRALYRQGFIRTQKVSVPVVVVGNISVGGTGKTPLCAYLVEYFRAAGWSPGIVSRGYGGIERKQPYMLTGDELPAEVGDEPLMLHHQTGVPVCVCIKRPLAVQHLVEQTGVDMVFSDDGLQHLALPRSKEILVVDGQRGFGNGFVLPVGPLREFPNTLQAVDLLAVQVASFDDELHQSLVTHSMPAIAQQSIQQQFTLTVSTVKDIDTQELLPLSYFKGQTVHAVAGIGNPKRFFLQLQRNGLDVIEHAFPDHYRFSEKDLNFGDDRPVLMTSKDAVKVRQLSSRHCSCYEVCSSLEANDSLSSAIKQLEHSLQHATE